MRVAARLRLASNVCFAIRGSVSGKREKKGEREREGCWVSLLFRIGFQNIRGVYIYIYRIYIHIFNVYLVQRKGAGCGRVCLLREGMQQSHSHTILRSFLLFLCLFWPSPSFVSLSLDLWYAKETSLKLVILWGHFSLFLQMEIHRDLQRQER